MRRRDVLLLGVVIFFSVVGAANIVFGSLAPETPTAISSGVSDATAVIPGKLFIPALNSAASVEHVGTNSRGNMSVPSSYETVAWYQEGTLPGDVGNAVIAGHVDNSLGLSGVFENLGRLHIGDTVVVESVAGERISFAVKEMHVYRASDAPAQEIFGGDGKSRNLVLITCDGAWDDGVKSYDKRLVVIAERI